MNPRGRLIAFLRTACPGADDWHDSTLLVGSGRVDSLALVQLAMWVEGEIGESLDPASFDLATEWRTVGSLLRFVENHGSRPDGRPVAPRSGGLPPTRSRPYRVVCYTPELRTGVAALQTHLWTPDVALNLATLVWKYEENPYTPVPLVYVALSGDDVVGMRGFFGAQWEVDGRTFDIPCACDLVVAPEHRNRGLFKTIMDAALEDLRARGYPYVFNLTAGSPLTHLGQLGLGWKGVGPLGILDWRPSEPAAVSRARATVRRIELLAGAYRRVRRTMRRRLGGSRTPFARFDEAATAAKGGAIRTAREAEPEALTAVLARVRHDGRIRHVRDRTFFGWRFRNPLAEWRFLLHGGAAPDGYLVLAAARRGEDKVDAVRIVDWEGIDEDTLAALLDAAIAWGHFDGLRIWAGTLPARVRALLTARGFRGVEHAVSVTHPRRAVLVGAIAGDGSWTLGGRPVLDLASWDLRMINADGV